MKHRKKKKSFKKWVGRIHLWLGLFTGVVVFIVAITGCIFTFNDEIKDVVFDWRKVEIQDQPYIEPSQLRETITQRYPGAGNNFVIYSGKDRPAAIYGVYKNEPYYFYFNPYSGEFLYAQNFNTDFFEIIKSLHMYLLLPPAIGKQVVGISTLIFLLMLITGIIMWWPKKIKHLKQSLQINWKAKWRRLNYDLHSIGGFYIHLLAIIVAITGLTFSYNWIGDGLYFIGNLGKEVKTDKVITKIESSTNSVSKNPIDMVFFKTIELVPKDEMYFVWDNGENNAIETGSYPKALNYDHQSNFYFHPQTGKLLRKQYYQEKSNGMKLQEMSYGLHTGQYFDLTGKILAFLISLFVASLPVTGFLFWWGRKNRMKHLIR